MKINIGPRQSLCQALAVLRHVGAYWAFSFVYDSSLTGPLVNRPLFNNAPSQTSVWQIGLILGESFVYRDGVNGACQRADGDL